LAAKGTGVAEPPWKRSCAPTLRQRGRGVVCASSPRDPSGPIEKIDPTRITGVWGGPATRKRRTRRVRHQPLLWGGERARRVRG
jgi:hypothetical protein